MNLSASNTEIDPVLLELFRTDLETHARALEEGLIEAEAQQSPDVMERLMRAAHSIKGAARMLALEGAVRLAHAMEDMLAKANGLGGRLTAGQVEVLLRGNDVFLHAAAGLPGSIPAQLESKGELIASLIGEMAALPVAAAVSEPPPPPCTPERMDDALLDLFRSELQTQTRVLAQGMRAATGRTAEHWEPLVRAAASIEGAARMAGLERPGRLAHAIKEFLLTVQRGRGQPAAVDLETLMRGRDVLLHVAGCAAAAIPAEIEQQANVIEQVIADLSVSLAPVVGTPDKSVSAAEPASTGTDKAVRVTAESLNRLVGLAGECLVQTRLTRQLFSGIQHIKQQQAAAGINLERGAELLREGDHAAAQAELNLCLEQSRHSRDLIARYLMDFADWSHRLEALIGPVYSEAVASRMRPFSDGTHGYPRMVHDLAKDLGKKVRFEIVGASTPVDREILDRLEAPLTHLLRNGVDHGIEFPAGRISRGKPEEGTLTLSAHQVSGLLRIAVADDGAGIDISELRGRITAAGYVSEGIARQLGDTEILEFLFLPGFSTSKTVTELSGRGVGLDVVQSTVRALGGSAHIQTTVGTGTRIELHLPITLSIVRALVVEVGEELYAIPLSRIDRLLRTTPESLELLEDRQFCTVDGQHVGVLDARQVLNVRGGGPPKAVCVVVISDRLSRYGLVVDRFVGERDLVVKALPACLGKVANISSGAILDDGKPVLILDTDDLVRAMDNLLAGGVLHKVSLPAEPAPAHRRRRVLVVDDSVTVREVERRLLENHGYEVEVAIDGGDAWNALQRSSFDLLATDVDMPRMDGLELVRHVRAAPRLATLPVVIVSYKEQPECRMKGMEAGANYYLTKSSFHDESLLTAVRDLIGEASAHADSDRK